MHRFFVAAGPAERAVLGGDQARQIATVLRLRPGERIVLIADGVEHEVELQAVAAGQVTGRVVARRPAAAELPFRLTLALPLLKGDHSLEVVEAATQLGVGRIVPFVALRSVARELSDAKRERWTRVAREAAETAHRGAVPEIAALATWDELIGGIEGAALVCWEGCREPHLLSNAAGDAITLVVGPEGGIDESEIAVAREHGARIVSLGPRVLRAETAAIAAVAMLVGAREGGPG